MRKLIVQAFITLDGVVQAPDRVIFTRYAHAGDVQTGSVA